jgi:hypothetical protein
VCAASGGCASTSGSHTNSRALTKPGIRLRI